MKRRRDRADDTHRARAGDGALPTGARTPEELETLFEDALLMRDGALLTALFEAGAILLAGDAAPIRGERAIVRRALMLGAGDDPYVADPRRVVQADEIALIVAARAVSVARRDRVGDWRYLIAMVSPRGDTGGEGRWGEMSDGRQIMMMATEREESR